MDAIIAALVSFFLIDPLQDRMEETLAAAQAPRALITEVGACARSAIPGVVDRVSGDPWWAMSSAVAVMVGTRRPEALLVEVAPNCAATVAAARPFLSGNEA